MRRLPQPGGGGEGIGVRQVGKRDRQQIPVFDRLVAWAFSRRRAAGCGRWPTPGSGFLAGLLRKHGNQSVRAVTVAAWQRNVLPYRGAASTCDLEGEMPDQEQSNSESRGQSLEMS